MVELEPMRAPSPMRERDETLTPVPIRAPGPMWAPPATIAREPTWVPSPICAPAPANEWWPIFTPSPILTSCWILAMFRIVAVGAMLAVSSIWADRWTDPVALVVLSALVVSTWTSASPRGTDPNSPRLPFSPVSFLRVMPMPSPPPCAAVSTLEVGGASVRGLSGLSQLRRLSYGVEPNQGSPLPPGDGSGESGAGHAVGHGRVDQSGDPGSVDVAEQVLVGAGTVPGRSQCGVPASRRAFVAITSPASGLPSR